MGLADVGVATEPATISEGLDFIPLTEERFDLVVPSRRLQDPKVRQLLGILENAAFRRDAGEMRGYDLALTGHAVRVPARKVS
jgi:putative molybdopterin biosynthesis protein